MKMDYDNERKALVKNEDVSIDYGTLAGNIQGKNLQVEAEESYKVRWRSIKILYMTMFFSSIQFAIVMSSLWPYLQKVDSTVTANFLGWTNAGFSLGQMGSSLLLGLWCQHRPAIEPLLFSILFLISGSLLYSYGEALPVDGINLILTARLLLGLSAGNVAVCRAVLSQSTTLKERTKAFADIAIWQAIGFAFGPAMQVAVVPIGGDGIHFDSMKLTLDIYTAPGFLGVIMGIINFVVLIFFFKEVKVDIYEGQKEIHVDLNHTPKPDFAAVIVTAVLFFVLLTIFALNETLISPLVMDEFAWTYKETVLYGGILLAVAGIIAILCFHFVKYLSSKYSERAVIAGGFVIILLGFIAYIPWGNSYPQLQTEVTELIKGTNKTTLTVGCNRKYTWCTTTPRLYFPQFLVAATLVGVGYPIAFLAVNTMYSKILGPRQQGAYMAFVSSIGSLARMIGPLAMAHMYSYFGPRWTYLSVNVIVTGTILLFSCFYDRLIPFHDYVRQQNVATA